MQITEYLNKRVFLIFLTVMLFFVSGCSKMPEGMLKQDAEQYTQEQIRLIAITERNRYQNIYTGQLWGVTADSNGNTFDTKTDSETFSSIYFDSNDTGDDHWNTSGESTYVDDDGNYCFHTNILLPALTQDFTSLEVTPYLHLEDGTETDLDFASFRVDYE